MSVCLFMLSRLNHLSICILNIYCLFLTVSVQWGLWSITTHIFPFLAIVVEMFPVRRFVLHLFCFWHFCRLFSFLILFVCLVFSVLFFIGGMSEWWNDGHLPFCKGYLFPQRIVFSIPCKMHLFFDMTLQNIFSCNPQWKVVANLPVKVHLASEQVWSHHWAIGCLISVSLLCLLCFLVV